MAEDKERFRRALDFMKMLGVSHSVVTPILRRLVKLYDNEWSLIEEESYRALADSYFEQVENKEAKAPARVTRNSSRRCAPSEIKAAEVPAEELISAHKKTNKRVTFSPVSADNENGSIDHIEHEEKQIQRESYHPRAAVARQDIACSYSNELQLECLSFKETLPNDLIHAERSGLKKPRIDAAASSSSISRKPELNVPLETPLPIKVKEEPLELTLVMQKKDVAPPPELRPAAIMSTREQERRIVLFNKDSASNIKSNESEDSLVRERPRRKVALLAHIEKRLSNQESDSLQSIAAAYGNASDDDSGASMQLVQNLAHVNKACASSAQGTNDSEANMQLVRKSAHVSKVACAGGAQGTNIVPWNDVTLKKGRETRSKPAMAVKEEPACSSDFHGDHDSCAHNLNDISRGQELVPVSALNTLSAESLPPFYYIKNNITFQNAYVNFALARIGEDDCCERCFGNCLERYPPCHCARETGGEFAYDREGQLRQSLLREAIADKRNVESSSARNKYCDKGSCFMNGEQCKGHLIRKFVKECWSKCGCNMRCGNRVVQRGICRKLQVAYISKGKGWGLQTLEDLPPGTFVCEYVGEILTNVELYVRNDARKGHTDHYPTLLDADLNSETMLRDEELLCLDATYYGNVARFVNHRKVSELMTCVLFMGLINTW